MLCIGSAGPSDPTPSPSYYPTPSPSYHWSPSPSYHWSPSPSDYWSPSPSYYPTPSPSFSPMPPDGWVIEGKGCVRSELSGQHVPGCVHSLNWPQRYGDNEQCQVSFIGRANL